MRKELLNGLTEEQIRKVKECNDPRDLLQLAKDEGVELNEEQLNAVNGGCNGAPGVGLKCPKCDHAQVTLENIDGDVKYLKCDNCGYRWTTKQ